MELLKENLEITETKIKEKETTYSDSDVIVPDVKPDILKILQVDAVSSITSKEVRDSHIKVSGMLKYNILYIPENDACPIKSITSEATFSHSFDKKTIPDNAVFDVVSDIERVEFTMLNSRKLNIKTAVVLNYTVFENKSVSIVSGTDNENTEAIYENISTNKLNTFEETSFTMRDRFELSSEKLPAAELLKLDITISDSEVKAITGKAVIKGNFNLCALYTDTDGAVNSIEGIFPFTEIAEIFELEEDTPCSVEYRLGDYEYALCADSDGDMRIIDFDITACAVIRSHSTNQVKIMKDCFCPGCHTDMVYDTLAFDNIIAADKNQYTVTEVIAPDKKLPQIASVYNIVARSSITKTTVENGKLFIEGTLDVYVLYISDNPQIPVYSFKKDIPLQFALDIPDASSDLSAAVDISCDHTGFNLNMANEVELKCTLTISYRLFEKKEINIISDCTICESSKESGIVIYFVQPGDTLWQIAKRYSVSVSELVEQNNIKDENSINVGQKLIIPFC